MRTIWTIIGVIVLIAIIVFIYNRTTITTKAAPLVAAPVVPPVKNISENTTTRETVIIRPVIIRNNYDCTSQAYIDSLGALRDDYLQKRVIWQNGINSNDPNTIQYRADVNAAYTLYYNEAIKCNLLQA